MLHQVSRPLTHRADRLWYVSGTQSLTPRCRQPPGAPLLRTTLSSARARYASDATSSSSRAASAAQARVRADFLRFAFCNRNKRRSDASGGPSLPPPVGAVAEHEAQLTLTPSAAADAACQIQRMPGAWHPARCPFGSGSAQELGYCSKSLFAHALPNSALLIRPSSFVSMASLSSALRFMPP